MRKLVVLSAMVCASSMLSSAAAVIDGDFVNWTLSSTGNGSMTRETANGNPGARLNATTFTFVGGPFVYDNAINLNFSTTGALAGTFSLGLDILSGPGDFGAGQSIGLLVQQGSDLYFQNLNVTGSGHSTWDTLSFNGTFNPALFTLLVGSGSATPNFAGGTTTFFGFSAVNSSNNRSVTEFYDNFNLSYSDSNAVPEPSTWLLFSCAGGALFFIRRR